MMNSISLWGVALYSSETSQKMFEEVNSLSIPQGYFVSYECCSTAVLAHFKEMRADFNSTFYKSWETILTSSRVEIAFDQIRHYCSTYGTDYQGTTWVPNDGEYDIPLDWKSYKVITPVTFQQLTEKCVALASSSINLSSSVVEYLSYIIYQYYNMQDIDEHNACLLIEKLSCREVQALLYRRFNILPRDKFALLRFIVESTIGTAMIVQSNDTIQKIRRARDKFDFSTLDDYRIKALSSIFLRYKNIFIAFKNHGDNSHIINRMRRLAKHTHTPLFSSFWDTVLANCPKMEEVDKHIDEISRFKLISIVNICRERLVNCGYRGFLIRNQKFFMKSHEFESDRMFYYYTLSEHLIKKLQSNTKVRLPKNFDLACPTSEKNFVGNYPYGTQYQMSDAYSFIGCYWRNEWGTHDFDLCYIDSDGNRIAWNGDFRLGSTVLFSGDMTNANPEATELMLFRNHTPEGIIKINRYNGEEGSKYHLILGQERVDTLFKNYMVDPANIEMRVECTSESREDTVGYVNENKLTLMKLQTGNTIIAGGHFNELMEIFRAKSDSFLKIRELFDVVDDDYEGDDFIDLSEPTKSSLIDLINLC